MSGLPPSPPSRTLPIPISTSSASSSPTSIHNRPNSTSHHVRSLSFSFGTTAPAAPPSTSPSSTYSPTTPSPILAGMNALAAGGSASAGGKSSFFSTSPRPVVSKDWASSWTGGGGGGGAGGSAVVEDDEDEGGGGAMGLSKSLQGLPAGSRVQGWAGSVIGSSAGSNGAGGTASLLGSAGTGTRVVVAQPEGGGSQKINGVLRRLSLGGAGLSRPNFIQQPQQGGPTPLPTPVTATQSFFPPPATAVPDLIPDRPTTIEVRQPRGRKASVGGKGKRGISPTGERMLQGHHGGLF